MTTTNDAPAPALSGSGVRVKPLEWRGDNAETMIGEYVVCFQEECYGRPRWEAVVHYHHDETMGIVGDYATRDEAVSGAQEHYATRILSALASDASPRGGAIGYITQKAFDELRANPDDPRSVTVIRRPVGPTDMPRIALYAHPAPATVEMRGAHGRGKLIEKALTRFLPLVCSATGSEDVSVPADDFAVILGLLKATLPNQASAIEAAYERAIQDAERSFRRNRDRSRVLTCLRERIATEIAALAPATDLDSGTTGGQK